MAASKRFYYAYECAPSSEVRGRREGISTGCGLWMVRGSIYPLGHKLAKGKVQGRPCPECGKRQRLNLGMIHKCPDYLADKQMSDENGTWIAMDFEARKAWALDFIEGKNRLRKSIESETTLTTTEQEEE